MKCAADVVGLKRVMLAVSFEHVAHGSSLLPGHDVPFWRSDIAFSGTRPPRVSHDL